MDPKLRLVLDYVPCDQCLETPSADQETFCSICRRLHREIAVKVTERREVVIERPAEEAPVAVHVPAAAEPSLAPEAPARTVEKSATPVSHVEIVVGPREAGERVPGGPSTEIVIEDLEPVAPAPAEAPVAPREPESPFIEADFEESFTYVPLPRSALPPPAPPVPVVEPEPGPAAPSEAFTIEPWPESPAPEPTVEEAPAAPADDVWSEPVAEPEVIPEATPEPEPEPEALQEPLQDSLPETAGAPAAELWPEERVPETIEEVVPFEPLSEDEGVQTFEVLPDDDSATSGTPVEALEGVGPLYATRLREVGLSSVEDFLARDAWQVANATGISVKLLEQWGSVARFVALGAVVAHAEALVRVGIATPSDLVASDAGDLTTRLNAHLGAAGRLGDVPAVSEFDVRRWQAAARS